MTKHFCEISEKEIKKDDPNFGRTPTVIPVTGELSIHILFVQRDGRCNVSDVSKAGMLQALEVAAAHVKKPASPEPAPEDSAKGSK
jgi:hypothetical protein